MEPRRHRRSGAACATALAALLAAIRPAAAAPLCTQVIGFSQTREWYEAAGAFEAAAGDARWQLLARFGAAVNLWADPAYEGWSEPLTSPCAIGADAPDRVVLTVTGGWGDNEDRWVAEIQAAIATIEAKIPSATEILLQSVVGGPDHGDCYFEDTLIRDSWQHAHIDAAIARVVGGHVRAGASPEVDTCADYRDAAAHLTEDGATALGAELGAFYAALDATTTTTVGGGTSTTTTTTLPSGCGPSDVRCGIDQARAALAAVTCGGGCDCTRFERRIERIESAFETAVEASRPRKCRRKLLRAMRLGRRLATRIDAALDEGCLDPPAGGGSLHDRVSDVVVLADALRGGGFCARP